MDEKPDIRQAALEALRVRITKIIPSQIRSCVEELSQEQIWWRPNEESNSVGNLVLHLSGSVRHYLARGIGGVEYERDRPAEFAERRPLSKQELLESFDETISLSAEALDAFDTARFLDATSEPNYYHSLFEQILGVAIHMATHAGQIVYVTKMLKEGSVDEIWIRAHTS
jgi:hypothetical protein